MLYITYIVDITYILYITCIYIYYIYEYKFNIGNKKRLTDCFRVNESIDGCTWYVCLNILQEPGGTYGEVDGPTLRNQARKILRGESDRLQDPYR